MTASHRRTTTRLLPVLVIVLVGAGCTSIEQRAYAPFVRDLDGLVNRACNLHVPGRLPRQVERQRGVV